MANIDHGTYQQDLIADIVGSVEQQQQQCEVCDDAVATIMIMATDTDQTVLDTVHVCRACVAHASALLQIGR